MYIKSFFSLGLELLLDFTDNSNEVKQCVLDMDTVKCQRARKVLVEYFLDKGIACWVELIKELFNQVKGQQVDAAVSLQIVLQ